LTLPAGLNLVTITGHFYGPDGSPLRGSISFSPAPAVLTSGLYGSIITGGASVTLDDTGSFSETLLATNDPNVSPVDWTYTVTESINGSTRSYSLALPKEAPNVILSQIAPASASGGNYVVITGPQGPQGVKGDTGYSVYSGSANPDPSLGNNGDVYIQYTSLTFLSVGSTTVTLWAKASGTWTANPNLIRGAAWYVNNAGTASAGTQVGDMLFRTDTGDIYQRNSCGWGTPVGNLNPSEPQPSDHGLTAWTFDPAAANTSAVSLSTGALALAKVYIRSTKTITNLWYGVTTAGSGLTASQNLLGIYDSTGALLRSTVDQSTAMTSTGVKQAALTSSVSLAPGSYWVAFLVNGTTPPQVVRATNVLSGIGNVNLSAANFRFGAYGASLTALPGTITPASITNVQNGTVWAAIN
jgi:hypothetical protein